MSKGSKETLTVLIVVHVTYVQRVKRLHYVHNIDTFNAMSKGSKDYVMLKQRTYTFLLITFLIFKQFSIRKKFWKAETETFPTISSNARYVEGVESYFDFRPLQHASTYMALDGMFGKVSVSAFQNFFWIENCLNIKKVISKNVFVPGFNITIFQPF